VVTYGRGDILVERLSRVIKWGRKGEESQDMNGLALEVGVTQKVWGRGVSTLRDNERASGRMVDNGETKRKNN